MRLAKSPAFVLALLLATEGIAAGTDTAGDDAERVIRREIRALNERDLSNVLDTFSSDALVFGLPVAADSLVGAPSHRIATQNERRIYFAQVFAKQLLPRTAVVDIIAVGSFAAVKLRTVRPADSAKLSYSLFIYRVDQAQILDVWHVASEDADVDGSSEAALIRRLVAASNEGDVEAFVKLFSPDARHFRSSGDPHSIGDEHVERLSGDNLRKAIGSAFSKGPPPQATTLNAFTLGELVVSHDRVALPKGVALHQLKIYRVRGGAITHDWTVYEQRTS